MSSRGQIHYGKGDVYGFYGSDIVAFQNISVSSTILIVDSEKNMEGSKSDGLLDLSNEKKVPNIFDIAYQNKQLASPIFAFQLGLDQFNEPSYFYYNISADEFSQAFFISATRKDYWTIPVKRFEVNGVRYNISEALIDTGTSLITLPPSLYNKLDSTIFSSNCARYSRNCSIMKLFS